MKLAVSNIAWPETADDQALRILQRCGVEGIEIAPTKVWPQPLLATHESVVSYRRFWEDRGLRIVALQALLFGRPDLAIFGSAAQRRETLEYLYRIIELAHKLGARALVFGSPKNRQTMGTGAAEVEEIALSFFRLLGVHAQAHGVHFCLEPNPVEYACDYITTGADGVALASRVGQPGFGLHLDSAAMTLSHDCVEAVCRSALPYWVHFHVSEPFLACIGSAGVDHRRFAEVIRTLAFPGWISIEMNRASSSAWEEELETSILYVQGCYV
jgi:sugar phosphate isomerase/epimerase